MASRTRLEQRFHDLHLSQTDALRQFTAEARRLGEGELHISARQMKRWLAGGAPIPRQIACRVLEGWLHEPVSRLLGPPDSVDTLAGVIDEGSMMTEAGRRSVEHAVEASSALDPSALEHLQAATDNAAHDYLNRSSLEMLPELVALRDAIYAQLDRTHKPLQQAELYLQAGKVCGLLSSVAFDLGQPGVADDLARAAHTYGSVIDHPSLRAWARALQVAVALWDDRPRRAVTLAEAALAEAPVGTAQVRLYSTRARALALIGARDEAAADLDAAAEQLDRAGRDPFLDGAGELDFGRSRAALCASSMWVALGDGLRAENAATEALSIFGALSDRARWSSGQVAASVDLATSRAINDNLAGVGDALDSVFSLPPKQRTEAVSQRLTNLGRVISRPRYRSIEASRIGEEIEAFNAANLRTTVRAAISAG